MKTLTISSLLAFTLAFAGGCGQQNTTQTSKHTSDHTEMIEHIAKGHGIQIGAATNADIVITSGSNQVNVVFSQRLLKNLPKDGLPVLHFSGPEKTFSPKEYSQFLNDLHDYLFLTYGEGKGPYSGK